VIWTFFIEWMQVQELWNCKWDAKDRRGTLNDMAFSSDWY